jgi:glycosyltransferase involved in cell wall biosynthesis
MNPGASPRSHGATSTSPTWTREGSSRRRLGRGVAMAFRDPKGFVRLARDRSNEVPVLVIHAVPGRVRRPIARPIVPVTDRMVRRWPSAPLVPDLAVLARVAVDPGSGAAPFITKLGTSPSTPPASRERIARYARSLGLREATRKIIESLPDRETGTMEALRADLAYAEGRYADAVAHGRRAGERPAAILIADMSEGRLRALDPAWRPDLGDGAVRLNALRGKVTRGRILHIVSSSAPYRQAGYTVRSQSVAHCQQAVGLDPQFATRAGFPSVDGIQGAPALDVVDGVPYHRLAPDFAGVRFDDQIVTQTARAAVPLIEQLRPAAIQPASDFLQALVGLALGEALGVPVVYEVRGFLEETWASQAVNDQGAGALDAERYRLRRAAETEAMLRASAVVTLSATMRDEIAGRGVDEDRIVVIPNAVDVERFVPMERDETLARTLGIASGDEVVGYISSFSPYEGIKHLLQATALLRERGRRVRVLLVGDGKDWDALVDEAHRLRLDDGTLIMPGRVPHDTIRSYYSLIDVFVVPRRADRVAQLVTPLKPYEAMAMARPVVVSDIPALREMVIPGETGALFRAEDSDDLANVLAGLLDDPALRASLGSRARAWVSSSRSWSENGRRYRELYERLGVA